MKLKVFLGKIVEILDINEFEYIFYADGIRYEAGGDTELKDIDVLVFHDFDSYTIKFRKIREIENLAKDNGLCLEEIDCIEDSYFKLEFKRCNDENEHFQ